MRRAAALAIQPTKGTLYMGMGPFVCGLVDNPTLEVHPLKHQGTAGRIWPSVNLKIAIFARFGTMPRILCSFRLRSPLLAPIETGRSLEKGLLYHMGRDDSGGRRSFA